MGVVRAPQGMSCLHLLCAHTQGMVKGRGNFGADGCVILIAGWNHRLKYTSNLIHLKCGHFVHKWFLKVIKKWKKKKNPPTQHPECCESKCNFNKTFFGMLVAVGRWKEWEVPTELRGHLETEKWGRALHINSGLVYHQVPYRLGCVWRTVTQTHLQLHRVWPKGRWDNCISNLRMGRCWETDAWKQDGRSPVKIH